MLSDLIRKSQAVDAVATASSLGVLLLRVVAGAMLFWIHGWHKLEGGIEWLRNGTPWRLAEEVAAMHTPAPVIAAFVATAAQLVCPVFLIAGLFTRISAAVLTVTLGVAVLQNVLADRDPQLAVLYVLVVASLALAGGGRWSLDAAWSKRSTTAPIDAGRGLVA